MTIDDREIACEENPAVPVFRGLVLPMQDICNKMAAYAV